MKQFKRIDIAGEDFDVSLTMKKKKIVDLLKKYTEGQLTESLNELVVGFAQAVTSVNDILNPTEKQGPFVTYLAGPMEFAQNQGAGWRTTLTDSLDNRGIIVKNPCKIEVEDTNKSLQENTDMFIKAKAEQDWKFLREIMDPTQDRDYRAIEESDFVILYLDHKAGPGGTYCELEHCKSLGIPVYGICEKDFNKENSWILNTILRTGGYLFSSFEELLAHLDGIYFGE